MNKAYIGLGSNLDSPVSQLSRALLALRQLPQTELLRYSSYYLTKPIGPQEQPDFVNAVAELDTVIEPSDLLEMLLKIETQQGRVRNTRRWGPRTLDLDLLLYSDEEVNEENLKIPHPEMSRRQFVLEPLVEIAPEVEIPGIGLARDLLDAIKDSDLEIVKQYG